MRKRIALFDVGHVEKDWEVLEITQLRNRPAYKCRCKCGMVKIVDKCNLHTGKTGSCGQGTCKKLSTTHGLTGHPLHKVWGSIRARLKNPTGSNSCYVGITLDPSWEVFATFYTWALSNGYAKGLSIERLDRFKGYSPDNCTWATAIEQSQNRSKTKKKDIPFKGVYLSKPRKGDKLYENTGRTPYYFIVIYNGKRYQEWGFPTAEAAYVARVQFIKDNYDGLVHAC